MTVLTLGVEAKVPLVGLACTCASVVVGVVGLSGGATTVVTAAGVGTSAGAILGGLAGATTGEVAKGAMIGAAVGGTTATAITSTGVGAKAMVEAGVSATAVGWLVLGSAITKNEGISFDCWKPVVREESKEKTNGRFLREIMMDERINLIKVENSNSLPMITLENVWNERFLIEYVMLPNEQLALHARKIYES